MASGLKENLSVVIHGKGDLRLENTPVKASGPDDVLIEIKSGGICGTDIHLFLEGNIGSLVATKPYIPGHESAGQVIKVGDNVKHLKPGDRVAIEPVVGCGKCTQCKLGHYQRCDVMTICSIPPHDGNLCRYKVHNGSFCHKLPDNVSYEEAALLEPLAVVVHAVRRAGVSAGNYVMVCGAGPVGLLCLQTAKAFGASHVVVTDIVDHRLEIAKKLGADFTVNVKNKTDEQIVAEIWKPLGGKQPNVTVECTGAEASTRVGIKATAQGGVLSLVGFGPDFINVPMVQVCIRELVLQGTYIYANSYKLSIDLVSQGKVNMKPIITHRYKLEQVKEAFETARTSRDNALKVMFNL
jgi:L-iditol 2-dehydrogenase